MKRATVFRDSRHVIDISPGTTTLDYHLSANLFRVHAVPLNHIISQRIPITLLKFFSADGANSYRPTDQGRRLMLSRLFCSSKVKMSIWKVVVMHLCKRV